jgi:hypothetical protein
MNSPAADFPIEAVIEGNMHRPWNHLPWKRRVYFQEDIAAMSMVESLGQG